ncbi:extracellular solute-binding protein [Nonomuraea sp. NPDC049725]|uniref:ABC transporter substrate-binding protein n=1 Tax=Nonomuraea sp. NPDC049725 TaxID=3154508 RepID=UPI00343F6D31
MLRNHRPSVALAGTALAFAVGATGCAGVTTTSQPTAAATPAQVGTSCDKYGKIKLTVGMSEAGEAIANGFKDQVKSFQAANPDVTIDLQIKDWASSASTIKLVMSGNNPPDVMQGNSGWAINGALWKAGLLLNLDPYAQAFGWNEKFPESALTVNKFSPDGKELGEGNLVALPPAIQYVGVFYNKAVLKKIGITDPATLDDKTAFLQALDKAKAAGVTPVMLGDSEKWPALHNLSLFNGWYVAPEAINNWVYNKAGSTYDDEGHLKASTDMRTWMEKGYFNSDALATSFTDATNRFGKGEAAFFITGSWALGDIGKALGDDAGFMLFPAGDTGKHAAVGGYSLPFSISAKSKYPDCAAAFIDYVTAGEEAVAAQIAAGRPSATKAGAQAKIDDPLLKQMVDEYGRLTTENGLFTWEDWPTPTMLTFQGSEAQRLLSGATSPKEYNQAVQKNWDDYMKTRS